MLTSPVVIPLFIRRCSLSSRASFKTCFYVDLLEFVAETAASAMVRAWFIAPRAFLPFGVIDVG